MGKNWNLVIAIAIGGLAVHGVIAACGDVAGRAPDAQAADVQAIDGPVQTGMAVPPGTIVVFAGTVAPDGWLLCDGSEVSRASYGPLFAVVGTIYGQGDRVNTFALPELRGRTVVGVGAGAGLSDRALGQRGGEEQHKLTVAEMPSHTHREQGSNRLDGATGGATHYQDVDNVSFGPVTTAATGGDQPHNTMPPFVALNYIIKT